MTNVTRILVGLLSTHALKYQRSNQYNWGINADSMGVGFAVLGCYGGTHTAYIGV